LYRKYRIVGTEGTQVPSFYIKKTLRLEDKIKNWVVEFIAEDAELFLVDLTLKGTEGNQRLTVTLDGDKGIQIDKCVLVSRKLGHWIEEEELIPAKYNLEVTSAGMGVPLKITRQYKKNEGRQVEVTLVGGEKKEGKLISSNEEGITLSLEEKEETIAFKEIEKTIVVVSFK
jgi:ribosome maturation factor RimP